MATAAEGNERRRWLPLESNPEVMNKFVYELGVSRDWAYTDVYGLDEDLLAMVPQPVAAVLLLFPINEQEQAQIELAGQVRSSDLVFVRQTIGNACGTIGLIHSVCNNAHRISLGDGFFARFIEDARSKSADELATALEDSRVLSQVHEEAAQLGQTEAPGQESGPGQAPAVDDDVNLHFICFVEKGGHLYELDGRKPFPINHGPASPETLLTDAVAVIRKFMERDPTNLQFTMIALTPAVADDE